LSSSLEPCLAHPEHVKPTPPVYEVAWELNQKQSVSTLLAPVIGHSNYTLLALYQRAAALSVGGFILGSTNSRFVTTSHVMAIHPKHPNQLFFAKIEHFAKLDIKDNSKAATVSVWTACVRFYDEHQCKVWFGGPTQVWTRTTSLDAFYIPLHCIKTRVAYCETLVDFGRVIGNEIVSLLSNLVTNVLIRVHNYYAHAYKNRCHVISDRRLVFESCRQGGCVYMYTCPSPLTGDLYSSLVGRVAVCMSHV